MIIYTAITNDFDKLRDDQYASIEPFVAFTHGTSEVWEIAEPYSRFLDPRRNARIHKVLAHQFLDTDYSIWLDGAAALKVAPADLVEKYLKDADIAVFAHPERNCLYDEIDRCIEWELDDPKTLFQQEAHYKRLEFPEGYGLWETGVILRRHSPAVENFNNLWWSEVCRYSKRDQISFPYALKQSGIRLKVIPGFIKRGNDYVDYTKHQN